MELTEPIKLLLALAIGAVIGLERERSTDLLVDNKKDPYAPLGVRTFSLVAILGALSGLLVGKFLFIAIFLSVMFGLLTMAFYIYHTLLTKDIGITTELSLIFTFVIGFLIATQALPVMLSIAIAVVLLLLLSRKEQIKDLVQNVRQKEINAFVSFAIIALLVLPFLPDESIKFGQIPMLDKFLGVFNFNLEKLKNIEIINPFKLWTIVALITGLDLLGHFLERTIGQKKGWIFTSIAGGFISSTATTLTLAQQSKNMKAVNPLVASAVFANMASFFQIAIIIGAINATLLVQSIPLIASLIISSLAAGMFFLVKKEKESKKNFDQTRKSLKDKEIINLVPALKFAGIFFAIRLISKIALEFFGSAGFLAATALGALSGLDAVLINASELAGKSIDYKLAIFAFILANAINLISKTVYSFMQGSREFTWKFGAAMGIVILASLVGLLF